MFHANKAAKSNQPLGMLQERLPVIISKLSSEILKSKHLRKIVPIPRTFVPRWTSCFLYYRISTRKSGPNQKSPQVLYARQSLTQQSITAAAAAHPVTDRGTWCRPPPRKWRVAVACEKHYGQNSCDWKKVPHFISHVPYNETGLGSSAVAGLAVPMLVWMLVGILATWRFGQPSARFLYTCNWSRTYSSDLGSSDFFTSVKPPGNREKHF